MSNRLNQDRLNIGTYVLQPYARTEQHIKDLSEAGIDFVVDIREDRPTFDLFEKYGVGAFVSRVVPGWGCDPNYNGKMAEINTMDRYEAGAANFVDHPAIWGICVGDEPSAEDFPYYGKVINKVKQLFPNQHVNLNLFPNYAFNPKSHDPKELEKLLGAPSYEKYIEQYCRYVSTDYICYDNYPFVDVPDVMKRVSIYYENLRIVAEACLRTGRSLWIVPQVNSGHPAMWTTENNLRFQAYAAMAFGAETIIWGCYTAGWWWNQVVDKDGNKTEQYEKLKKINAEIRTIGEEYMRFRRVSTHFVGFANKADMEFVKQEPIDSLYTGVFLDVKTDNGAPIVVGEMVSRTDRETKALMICAADDPLERDNKEYNVTFEVREGKKITAIGGNGKKPVIRMDDGSYAVSIVSNEGVLMIAE